MRRAARTDGNHAQIVSALTKAGIRVLSLAPMGKGCPDLLCGLRGVNVLLEVKDPAQDPNKRALTPMEQQFHDTWPGAVFVVETAEQAISAVVEAARPRSAFPETERANVALRNMTAKAEAEREPIDRSNP